MNHYRRMHTIVFIVAGYAIFGAPRAATYYLSSVTGNDNRTAVEAQSPATPWKTPERLTSVSLAPGDRVLFARGEVFYGTITVEASGEPGLPITYGAWGSGDRAVISGTVPVTGWVASDAGGVYSASVNLPPNATQIEQLFCDATPMVMARYPNRGYIITAAVTGKTGFSSDPLTGSPTDWSGASVHLKSQRWSLDYRTVAAFDAAAGSVTLNAPANYDLKPGWGFFFNNHPAALDTLGEWYFDPLAMTVSAIMPDGGSPHGRTLEASVHAYGINLNNRQHVRIENLHFFGQIDAGIYGVNAHGLYVEDCVVEWTDGQGIDVSGNDMSLVYTRVHGANVGGISLRGTRCLIEACTIEKTGLLYRLNRRGLGGGCCTGRGVNFGGGENTIRGNTIDSTGYIGIGFGGTSNLIEHNTITTSCITIDDGAGIYTWSSDYDRPGAAGTVIRHNFVADARGAPEGTGGGFGNAHGIYLDDRTHSIRVDSNTCVNNELGIYLHNTRDHTVRGNVSYGNRNAQFRTQRDDIAGDHDMYGNVVSGNYFFAVGGSAGCIENREYRSNASPLALYSDNYCGTETAFDIKVFRDADPVWSRAFLDPLTSLLGDNLIRNGRFDSAQSWSAWPGELFTLTIDTEKIPGERCLRVDYGLDPQAGRSPLVNSAASFALTAGRTYRLRFSAAAQAEVTLNVVARQSASPYGGLGLSRTMTLGSPWQEFEFYFTASADEPQARIDFHNQRTAQTYWLNNVSLYRIADDAVAGEMRSRLFTNPGNTPLTVDLGDDRYRDLSGAFVEGQFTLAPWYSRVLVLDSAGGAVHTNRGFAASTVSPLSFPHISRQPGMLIIRAEAPGLLAIDLVAPDGRVVLRRQSAYPQALAVPTGTLAGGVYLLRCRWGGGVLTRMIPVVGR